MLILFYFSRPVLQCDVHVHKQQPPADHRWQHGSELGLQREQRPRRQRQQLEQQFEQHRQQHDHQQQWEEKEKSSKDYRKIQKEENDLNL